MGSVPGRESGGGIGMIEFERQFFDHAKWFLACQLRAMGGDVECDIPAGPLEFSLLGVHDFTLAMWIMCEEKLGRRVKFIPYQDGVPGKWISE